MIKDLTMLEKQNADKFNDVRYLHGFRFGVLEGFDEGYQRGMLDAINEFANKIKEYSGEHYLDCDGYGCQTELVFRTEEFLDDIVEQLKEQI